MTKDSKSLYSIGGDSELVRLTRLERLAPYKRRGNYIGSTSTNTSINKKSAALGRSIQVWTGSMNAIPSGWVLCNGLNGTPDLSADFVSTGSGNAIFYTKAYIQKLV